MNRPKWKVFPVVGRALSIFATAATLRLLEDANADVPVKRTSLACSYPSGELFDAFGQGSGRDV
jgi:hypothetical protein